jgi:hypothetical protein
MISLSGFGLFCEAVIDTAAAGLYCCDIASKVPAKGDTAGLQFIHFPMYLLAGGLREDIRRMS